MKRFCVMGLVLTLVLFCLTGCLRVNLGVVVREDGTASLTTKLMIEEDAYLTLVAFESTGDEMDETLGEEDVEADEENGEENAEAEIGEEGTEEVAGTDESEAETVGENVEEEEASDEEDSLDLDAFKKEVVGDAVYYSYEETVEAASYEELAAMLMDGNDEEGMDLFSNVEVKKDGKVFTFKAVTSVVSDAEVEESMNAAGWATLYMTVTMPGEVQETNGKQVDETTVEFVLDDFAEEQTLTVVSEKSSNMVQLVAIAACVGILIGCGAYFVMNKKKKRAEQEEEK